MLALLGRLCVRGKTSRRGERALARRIASRFRYLKPFKRTIVDFRLRNYKSYVDCDATRSNNPSPPPPNPPPPTQQPPLVIDHHQPYPPPQPPQQPYPPQPPPAHHPTPYPKPAPT